MFVLSEKGGSLEEKIAYVGLTPTPEGTVHNQPYS